jgi:hypothetical protein
MTGGYGGEDEKDPLGLFDVFRHGHVDVARWLVDDCGIAPILPEPDGPVCGVLFSICHVCSSNVVKLCEFHQENNVFRGALLSGKPELIQWLIDDYGCHISQLPDVSSHSVACRLCLLASGCCTVERTAVDTRTC